MQLLEQMKARLESEESPFRAQLLKEDIARFEKLRSMAAEEADPAAFVKAGLYIGWTRDDMRTHELKEPLEKLLRAVHARAQGDVSEQAERAIVEAWIAFNRLRMTKLVHCL